MRRAFRTTGVVLFQAVLSICLCENVFAAACEESLAQLVSALDEAGGSPCRSAYRQAIVEKCQALARNNCPPQRECEARCDECLPPDEKGCVQCRRSSGKVEELGCPSCRGESMRIVPECIVAQDGTCDLDVTETSCDGGVCITAAGEAARCAKKFECRDEGDWVNRYERLPDGSERKQPDPKPTLQCVSESVLRDWSCQDEGSYQYSDRNCGSQICVSAREGTAACAPKYRCEVKEGRVRQFERQRNDSEIVTRDIAEAECVDGTHARSFSCQSDGQIVTHEQDCGKSDRVCASGQCATQCACLPREGRTARKRNADGSEERLDDKCAVHGLSGIDAAVCKETTLPDGRVQCTLAHDFKACSVGALCSAKKIECLRDRCEMQGSSAVVMDPDDNEKQRCEGGGKGDKRKRAQCLKDAATGNVQCKEGDECQTGQVHDGKGNCVVNKSSCSVSSGGVATVKDPFGDQLKVCEGGAENSETCPAVCSGEDQCFKGDRCAEGEYCKRLESGKYGCRKGKEPAVQPKPQPKPAKKQSGGR